MTYAPKPWTIDRWSDKQGSKGISIKSAAGLHIANMVMSLQDDELATARFLCRAANCHKVLLEALKLAATYVGRGIVEGAYNNCAVSGEKALNTIESALAKAEEKP